MSRNTRKETHADINFPVGRIHRYLKKTKDIDRVSDDAAVYLAAVLEYVSAEVLELAGNARSTEKGGRPGRIMPRHILDAVVDDKELQEVFGGAALGGAGYTTSGLKHAAAAQPNAGGGGKSKKTTAAGPSRKMKQPARSQYVAEPEEAEYEYEPYA